MVLDTCYVTAFGKLFSTTAFRLVITYLLIFTLFAVTVLGYVAWNTRRLLEAQLVETIETEINSLAEQYSLGGPRRLGATIERRARQARGFFYLLTDLRGEVIAGNAAEIASSLQATPGWQEISFRRSDEQIQELVAAKIRLFILPNGMRLVVGHDLNERQRLRQVIRQAMGLSIALVLVLGAIGAWIVSRRILQPVDNMTAAARKIMAGNLSERLPVRGIGDEFDRLAESLNLMLNRIGELMAGLRDVSDNIAHDLRTPLTRLRAAADEALRSATTREELHSALERTIDESDGLIKIFNALLMIARAEAGSIQTAMSDVDIAIIVADVAELYGPVAEEERVMLKVGANPSTILFGSRELLGQALANLVDNAVKYGRLDLGNTKISPEIWIESRVVGEALELSVADRGPGVPVEYRERVLERFFRQEKSRVQAGSGLGLSLVSAIARIHGGRLRLEDNDPGLRVVLILPIRKEFAENNH